MFMRVQRSTPSRAARDAAVAAVTVNQVNAAFKKHITPLRWRDSLLEHQICMTWGLIRLSSVLRLRHCSKIGTELLNLAIMRLI